MTLPYPHSRYRMRRHTAGLLVASAIFFVDGFVDGRIDALREVEREVQLRAAARRGAS